jgi:peptidoglycan hydrolase CwlO-like protein
MPKNNIVEGKSNGIFERVLLQRKVIFILITVVIALSSSFIALANVKVNQNGIQLMQQGNAIIELQKDVVVHNIQQENLIGEIQSLSGTIKELDNAVKQLTISIVRLEEKAKQ